MIDTDAVLTLPRIVDPDSLNSFLEDLVPFVESGTLCFPDLVIAECRRIAKGEVISAWIRAVAGNRHYRNVPYSHVVQILASCAELVDDETTDESSQVAVAALADCLRSNGKNPLFIVTEDTGELPTRLSLEAACSVLDFTAMDAATFVKSIQLDHYLTT